MSGTNDGTPVDPDANPSTVLLTPGMVAAGLAGAFGGICVAHLATGLVNGRLIVEGIEAFPKGFLPIATWAAPVILLIGLPAAVLLELLTHRFPRWAATAAYCAVGAGLGLMLQLLWPSAYFPYYGAAAAIAGKAVIEWDRHRIQQRWAAKG